MMNEHFLSVSKTARYFSLGNYDSETTEVWIVIHGYAQLAKDFITSFEEISELHRFVVAPEGLNKFYAKGFGGLPAATWMTSEMREQEINDYVKYLDALYEHLGLVAFKGRIILLGFSQGVATATRWLHHTKNHIDELIICSGDIAAEVKNPVSLKLQSVPTTYITGDNDRLIDPLKLTEIKQFLSTLGAREIVFSGGHEINIESLKSLI